MESPVSIISESFRYLSHSTAKLSVGYFCGKCSANYSVTGKRKSSSNSDFNVDEETLSSMIQDYLTLHDFVNVAENLTSTKLRDIETIYAGVTAVKEAE